MLSRRLQDRWWTGHTINHYIATLLDPEFCHSITRDLLAPGLEGSSSSRRGGSGGGELLLDLRDHCAGLAPL